MESELANWIVGLCGGGAIGLIIAFVIIGVAKSGMSKMMTKFMQKNDNKKIAEETTKLTLEQFKNMMIKLNVTPLVESDLKKVYDLSVALINDTTAKNLQSNLRVISIIEKFVKLQTASSYGLDEDKKAELFAEIDKAKEELGYRDGEIEITNVSYETQNVPCETNKKEESKNNSAFL